MLVTLIKNPLITGTTDTLTSGCQTYRYCLETDELLQRWELSNRCNYRIITCDGSKGYCVWDKDGRISFHQLTHQDTHPKYFDTVVGCSLAEDNQLIYVLRGGCIKIFNI